MNGWILALLITAGLLGILLLLRLRLRAEYFSGEVQVWLCVARLRFSLYSSIERKTKKKEGRKKTGAGKVVQKETRKSNGPGFHARDLAGALGELGGVAARLLKRVRVEELRGRVTAGGADAAEVAITYGRLWAVVGAVHALLERFVLLKSFDVDVLMDFESDKTRVEGVTEIGFRCVYLLAAALSIGNILWKRGATRREREKTAAENGSGDSGKKVRQA